MTGDLIDRLRSKATDCHQSEEALYLEAAHTIQRLSERCDEANAALARVWKALGIETYEQAGGKEISEIVADYKQAASVEAGLRREFLARAEAAETQLAEIEDRRDHTEGGLQLLLAAAKAGDPMKEIIFRIEEELRQLRRPCPAPVSGSTEAGNGSQY